MCLFGGRHPRVRPGSLTAWAGLELAVTALLRDPWVIELTISAAKALELTKDGFESEYACVGVTEGAEFNLKM